LAVSLWLFTFSFQLLTFSYFMTDRREFLTKAAALAALPLLGFEGNDMQGALPSLKGRKILFIYGGYVPHEPEKFAAWLSPWLKEEGADVLEFKTLDPYADKALMDSIDLIIQTFTKERITKEQEDGLLQAIEKNGTGMAGWHGGMCDTFHDNERYHFMTGGQWVAHPGGITGYDVKIVDHADPVTSGIKDFTLRTEQYYMHVDPNVKVLATTRFNGNANFWIEGCVMPVIWKKMHGKGRIFYTSVGHNLSHVLESPEAIETLQRGIRWASASRHAPAEKWMSPVYSQQG
jgi:type 1 glutamine amidotransferase